MSAHDPIISVDTADDCTCPNQHPELDEFIANGVNIHFEMMGHAQFWMSVDDPRTGRTWHLNFGAVNPKAHGYSIVEELTDVERALGLTDRPASHRGGQNE